MFHILVALGWAVLGTCIILDDKVTPFIYGVAVACIVVNNLCWGLKK